MNNPMAMIAQMLNGASGNPQMVAQNILRQNPQFAAMIRGQNPRQMAEGSLRQMGIDPSQIMNMMQSPTRGGNSSYINNNKGG